MMIATVTKNGSTFTLEGDEADVRERMRYYAACGYYCVGARV